MRVLISGGPEFVSLARLIEADEYLAIFPTVAKALSDADLKARSLDSFSERQDWFQAWAWVRAAAMSLNGAIPSPEAAGFVLSRAVQLLPNIIALDKAKPDVAVVHNDVEPVTRLIALWAKARGVPCIHVPHAIYVDHPWRGPKGTDVHDLVSASHIAAVGPYQARWYAERSDDAEIRITGAPRWDWIAKWTVSKERARHLLHIPQDAFVVTYATSWGQKTSREGFSIDPFEHFQEFLRAVKETPLLLIAKLHPSQRDGQRYIQAMTDAGVKGLVTAFHLPHVITASDLVVTFGPSNVVIEAAALGRRVACHLAPFPGLNVPWFQEPHPDDLMQLVLAGPPIDKAALAEFSGPLDGRSCYRVAAWIRELCLAES